MACPECQGLSRYHFRAPWALLVMWSQCEEKAFSSLDLLSGSADTRRQKWQPLRCCQRARASGTMKQRIESRDVAWWRQRKVKPCKWAKSRCDCSRTLKLKLCTRFPPGCEAGAFYLAFQSSLWPVPGSILSLRGFLSFMEPLWCLDIFLPWFSGEPIYKSLLESDSVSTHLVNKRLQDLNWYSFPRHRKHLAEMGKAVKPAELEHHRKQKALRTRLGIL